MFAFEIDIDALPQQEQTAALYIRINLMQMRSCVISFSHSLDLCQFAMREQKAGHDTATKQMFVGWVEAAVRNGALMAYAFERMMEAINGAEAPTVHSMRDRTDRKLASKLFAKEFPTIGGIRTSAAHPAQLGANEEEVTFHGVPEGIALPGTEQNPNGKWTFVSNLMSPVEGGVVLTSTVKGKAVSYELSLRKLQALDKVLEHFTRSFYPLENPKLTQIREEWLRTGKPPWQDQIDHPPQNENPDGK